MATASAGSSFIHDNLSKSRFQGRATAAVAGERGPGFASSSSSQRSLNLRGSSGCFTLASRKGGLLSLRNPRSRDSRKRVQHACAKQAQGKRTSSSEAGGRTDRDDIQKETVSPDGFRGKASFEFILWLFDSCCCYELLVL